MLTTNCEIDFYAFEKTCNISSSPRPQDQCERPQCSNSNDQDLLLYQISYLFYQMSEFFNNSSLLYPKLAVRKGIDGNTHTQTSIFKETDRNLRRYSQLKRWVRETINFLKILLLVPSYTFKQYLIMLDYNDMRLLYILYFTRYCYTTVYRYTCCKSSGTLLKLVEQSPATIEKYATFFSNYFFSGLSVYNYHLT